MMCAEEQERILERMPHFIAANYQAMLNAPSDEARVQAGLATFDRCLRLLTIIQISQYLVCDQEDISDPYLNDLLIDRFPLGDLQSWRKVFITTLKVYEGHAERLFVPEVYHLYWDTSDSEHHRSRLDLEQMLDYLVSLSNDWRNRKNLPSDATGWANMAKTVDALMHILLERLAFLTEYELLRIIEKSGTTYTAERHVGLEITLVTFEHEGEHLQSKWYYLGKSHSKFLVLDPLLTSLEVADKETAIFRLLTTHYSLLYLLALTGKLLKDTTQLEKFMALMDVIEQIKQVIRRKTELTWLQVTATAKEITASRMATVSDKFDSDVYLQRQGILSLFKTFMASGARCFVLTGKSGAGKSNFVLSLQEEYRADHDLCLLMIDASQIDTTRGLTAFISDLFRRRWSLRPEDMADVWEEIDHLLGIDRQTVLLVLDAINESRQPQALLRQINELLQQPWNWMKVLITSRPETWRRMCHGQSLAESLFFQSPVDASIRVEELPYLAACNVDSFDWDELRTAYARYQAKFNLCTDYDDLSAKVRQLIREPLQLWMVALIYKGKSIPTALPSGRLIERYISALLKTKRLYPGDVRFLRDELVPLMAPQPDQYTNLITAEMLEKAEGNLLERVFSEGYYSTGERVDDPFQRLADAQIAVSRIRGIDSIVLFKYERFYDHFLGEYLYEQITEWYTEPIEGYHALFESIENHPFAWGAVRQVLYLTLQNQQCERIKTLAVTDDGRIAHLIISALVEFSAENPRAVRQIVRSLLSSDLRGSRETRLTARDIALRTALQTTDDEALLQGLLSSDQELRDRAVQYVHSLSQVHSDLALDVFEGLIEPVRRVGLPNPSVVQTAFTLGSILLVENSDEAYQKRLLAIIRRLLRRALYASSQNIAGKLLRALFLRLVVQSTSRMMQLASSTLFGEWGKAFSYSLSERAPAVEILPYLDYRYGTWDEIAVLMPKVRSLESQFLNVIALFTIIPRGVLQPNEALPVIEQLYKLDYGGNRERIDAIYTWRDILECQQEVKDIWLTSQRNFVKRCLEENLYGYGIIKTDLGRYQYYPLMFYASIWSRVHPGQEVDLIRYFLHQAETANDRQLLLHIIDGFGDRRVRLVDYRGPLRSLKAYVRSRDEGTREHLVNSLARLYGPYRRQISHFLLESDAPQDLQEAVHQQSLRESMPSLYLGGNLFLRDTLLTLPPSAIQTIIQVLEQALRQKEFSNAVELVIKHLLNELSGGDIFVENSFD